MSAEKKRRGKFITPILIGGALGSVVAWAFGSRKRRESISEKVDQMLHSQPAPKPSLWERIFRKKD